MRAIPLLTMTLVIFLTGCLAEPAAQDGTGLPPRQDLVDFHAGWRAFQSPPLVDGVPDYSEGAMAKQAEALVGWQTRLHNFDLSGWSIAEKIDWHIVRAEMNGLDFDHRVLKPWAFNPAWYAQVWMSQSDTPEHEGPLPAGFIDVWKYDFPLSEESAEELAHRIRTIPTYLASARVNLIGDRRDIWRMGIEIFRFQSLNLVQIQEMAGDAGSDFGAAITEARLATDQIVAWLEDELPSKTAPSGIGEENYDWYLKNVHLSPYGWEDELRIMEAELARAYTALRLEENNNRGIPEQTVIDSAENFDRLQHEAVDDFMDFFAAKDIVEIKPYMDAALRAQIRPFNPDGPGQFFSQVIYRDPIVMQTHWYHWIDLERMREAPHASPIRATPLLYNIWDSRSEGLATAMEEMMMHAGFIDGRPRSRELIWILIAQRAARAIAGLKMHSNEWTLQEASDYAVDWTPRNWMKPNGTLVGFEQHLYLEQPGYGSSYLAGKAQIEELLSAWSHQEGADFTVRRFFDSLNDAGLIPASLIQWEMTGERPEHLD